MTVFLRGGIDSIYTTDPKVRKDVQSDIDVPYEQDKIIDCKQFTLGPHLAPISKWADRMTVLNGVQMFTAGHGSGGPQILRMRTGVSPFMPSILDIVGERRQGQPLTCVTFGTTSREPSFGYTPSWFGSPGVGSKQNDLFSYLDAAGGADLEMLAAILEEQAAETERRQGGGLEATRTAEHARQSAALLRRLPTVPPFKRTSWGAAELSNVLTPDAAGHEVDLQRMLWMIENDLTATAFARISDWDSHIFNTRRQEASSAVFFSLFDRFLTELASRTNPHCKGSLLDNTTIVCASELGRFPRLNPQQGKDHFPEAPMMFFGPGLKKGTFGQTGTQMEATPISLKTGKATSTGGSRLTLDDVGATLLDVAGCDPEVFGYTGRILRFLENV